MRKSAALLLVLVLLMAYSLLILMPINAAPRTIVVSDNGVKTSNPVLSPTELWNFTVANLTAHTISLGWGRPVVANGIAYLRNTETYVISDEPPLYPLNITRQHTLGTIYALNASSGAKLWNFTDPRGLRSLAIIDGVAYVCSSDSTFTDGQSGGGNIYALDAVTGAQKWVYSIDGDIHWSSINNGVIYVFFQASGFNSYVCAVKTANGQELWKWKAGYYVELSPPAVGEGAIYFGTYGSIDNHYYAVSTMNGTELWSAVIVGWVRSYSTLVDGIVYFSSDNTHYTIDNSSNTYLYALDAHNSDKLWIYTVGFTGSSPIVAGGIVYVDGREATWKNPYAFSDRLDWGTSNVFALNASNGNKVWNYSANEVDFSSLTLIDDVVCFSSNGTFNALNAADGTKLWSYSTDGNGHPLIIDNIFPNYYGYTTDATINDGILYYYSGKTLHALDTSNGNSLWNYTTDSNRSFLTVANNTAYFNAGNTVYALSGPTIVHSPEPSPTETPSPSPSSTARPSPTPSPKPQQPEPFPTALVIAIAILVIIGTIALAVVICAGLLAYFKKRKS
jgi:outer membrane protein assembly factor BamB